MLQPSQRHQQHRKASGANVNRRIHQTLFLERVLEIQVFLPVAVRTLALRARIQRLRKTFRALLAPMHCTITVQSANAFGFAVPVQKQDYFVVAGVGFEVRVFPERLINFGNVLLNAA